MIWRCRCGRPNLESSSRCVDCGRPRPEAEVEDQAAETPKELAAELFERGTQDVAPPKRRWQARRPPAPGFVGRTLRRIVFHYRRVLVPFSPGLVLLVIPIQLGYLRISEAVALGQAANFWTLLTALALTVMITLVSYYLIILTAFSVRDESLDLVAFYTRLPLPTLGVLWLVTVFYGLAVFVGFLLVIVPGLIALTLFSLTQPLVVLDDATVGEALQASPRLVIGRGGIQALQVMAIIVLTELFLMGVSFALLVPLAALAERFAWPSLAVGSQIVVGGLLFPVHVIVLTLLYDEIVGIPRPEGSNQD